MLLTSSAPHKYNQARKMAASPSSTRNYINSIQSRINGSAVLLRRRAFAYRWNILHIKTPASAYERSRSAANAEVDIKLVDWSQDIRLFPLTAYREDGNRYAGQLGYALKVSAGIRRQIIQRTRT